MRKPIEDKSPLAAWATLARDEAGMSVEEVVAALGERGHSVQAATIRGIEGGSKGASARLRRLMAEVYGTKPPGVALERPETPDALVQALLAQTAAIAAQTVAISELVSRLESLAGDAIREGIEEALREAGLSPAVGGLPAAPPPERFV